MGIICILDLLFFARNLTQILEKREQIWNENQKHLLNIRIKEKLEKSERQKDYSKKHARHGEDRAQLRKSCISP